MAIKKWRGDAQAIPQVCLVTVTNAEGTDTFTLTINGKDLTVTGLASANDIYTAFYTARQATTIPEFVELTFTLQRALETSPATGLIVTGEANGRPFDLVGTATYDSSSGAGVTVVQTRVGSVALNEIQRIQHNGTGGTFTLRHGGTNTGNLAWNAAAVAVDAELEGLASIGVGNIAVTGVNGGPYTAEFIGSLAARNVGAITGNGTNLTGATSIDITTVQDGAGGTNHIYTLIWAQAETDENGNEVATPAGDYDFTWTHPISGTQIHFTLSPPPDFQITETQDAFDLAFGAGNVIVRYAPPEVYSGTMRAYEIEFTNIYGSLDMNPSGFNYEFVSNEGLEADPIPPNGYKPTGRVTDGNPGLIGMSVARSGSATGLNEKQLIEFDGLPTGGTFSLHLAGETAAGIAYNASAAALKTAIEGLASIVTVTVTKPTAFSWLVEFTDPAFTNLAQMTYTNNLTGGSVVAFTFQNFRRAVNEIQTITIPDNVNGGTFTIDYDGQVTGNIAWNASATVLKTALIALSNIGTGDVTVSKPAARRWVVTFTGALGGTNVVLMEGDGTLLQIAGSQDNIHVYIDTLGDGPNWLDEPENWVGGILPLNGDTIVYEESTVGCNYGIEYSYRQGAKIVSIGAASPVTFLTEENHNLVTGETIKVLGSDCVPRMDGDRIVTVTGAKTFTVPGTTTISGTMGRLAIYWNRHLNPDKIRAEASYSGTIGLPTWEGDYYEYRPTRLCLGTSGYGVMVIEIGYGEGTGSPLLRFNNGAGAVLLTCWKTASSISGGAALDWVGAAVDNKLRIYRGKVSIALEALDVTTRLSELFMGFVDNPDTDADVDIGPAVVMGTVLKSGGLLRCESALPGEVINYAGNLIFNGEGAAADMTCRGGVIFYNSNGTLGGNPRASDGGLFNFDGDLRPKVVTNPFDIYGDIADVIDTRGVITSLVANYHETTRMPKWGRHFQFTRSAIP